MKSENFKFYNLKIALIFSLILVETFFFTLRISASMIDDRAMSYIALNRFQLSDIIISLISLFVFSFILIFILFSFIEKINKYKIFLTIISFGFILSNLIKIFFDYADYSWHFIGTRNIYPLVSGFFIEPFFSLTWYLFPYILSILIVFKLKNNISKLIRFYFSFSLVFFFIMSFQIFSLNKIHKNLNNEEIKTIEISKKSDRKVLWIFFDGFDPKLAFSKIENNYSMDNFEQLFNNSVVHHEFYAPAKDTLYSFASSLIGKKMIDVSFSEHRMNLITENKDIIELNFENSIFGRLFEDGFDSSITGYGFHPFCNVIEYVKCEVFNEPLKWYDGILNIIQYNRIKAHFLKIGSHRDINPYIIKSMFKYIENENPTNLLFVHNRVPHLCHQCEDGLAGMAEKYFDYKFSKKKDNLNLISDRKDAYLINLKFIDSLVGEIFEKIRNNKSYKTNETLVILTSDHWAKDYYGDFITRSKEDALMPHPTLFLAKIIGDNDKLDIYEPDSGIHVQELIHEFLTKNINSHQDINKFFTKKNGYSIFMNPETKFLVEEDF